MPEQVDAIVDTPAAGAAPASVRETLTRKAEDLRDQALGKAQEYASMGKEKATGALDSMAKIVGETAGTLDDKLGVNVGGYVQKAADAINDFAETLRGKDVEDLIDDARDAVKRHPAIAIGAAAAVGFLLARVMKSSASDAPDVETSLDTAAPPSANDINV